MCHHQLCRLCQRHNHQTGIPLSSHPAGPMVLCRAFQYSAALQRAAAKVYSNRAMRSPAPTSSCSASPAASTPTLASGPPSAAAQEAGLQAALRTCTFQPAPGSFHWSGPITPDGLLCGALGLSLPPAEVEDTFWHWGGQEDRERGAHAWLAPLSFKHCTPLHLAAFYGHTSVVEVLLNSGACDPHARNAQVQSPLSAVCTCIAWKARGEKGGGEPGHKQNALESASEQPSQSCKLHIMRATGRRNAFTPPSSRLY